MSEVRQAAGQAGGDAAPAPGYVPASDQGSVAAALQAELLRRSAVVATAESLTGGRLADVLSEAPGSSDTFVGGVVSYATDVKRNVLGVSDETVERYGVVSAECAEEMAAGARRLVNADYAVSTTGVAGPTTQDDKPVGLVYVGVAGPGGVTSRRFEMEGDRAAIREKVVKAAVDLVLEVVTGAGAE
jgi:nicotinamide-nucleotide amidase